MAISKRNDYLRALYRMVGKGSVQFSPDDRVPVQGMTRTLRDGTVMNYLIGGVSYDGSTCKLSYSLYNDRGRFIPPEKRSRDLELLEDAQLVPVLEKVTAYFGASMTRKLNIESVENGFADGEKCHIFPENAFPHVLVSDERGVQRNAVLTNVFAATEACPAYVTGRFVQGDAFNMFLSELPDAAIVNVISQMPAAQLYRRSVEEGVAPAMRQVSGGMKL